jgi:hypothetical protein
MMLVLASRAAILPIRDQRASASSVRVARPWLWFVVVLEPGVWCLLKGVNSGAFGSERRRDCHAKSAGNNTNRLESIETEI